MEKSITGTAPDKHGKQKDTGCGTSYAGTSPADSNIVTLELVGGILSDNELYLKTIFNFVQTGLIVIDADTHTILDVNPRAIEMLGVDRETIIGNVCHRFLCPQDKGKCPITDLA